MPASVTLRLFPRSLPDYLPYLGEAVRALIYDSMRQSSPEFAARIHADNDYKPFVASAPIPPRRRQAQAGADPKTPAEDVPWAIRCGCLDEELADALIIGLWERYSGGESIRLGPAHFGFANPPWKVTHVAGYHDLMQAPPKREWQFRFLSPTAVTSRGRPIPLPVPDLVFRGLAIKWNMVAPAELRLPEEIVDEMPDRMELTACKGESRVVRLTSHGETGFRGSATFRVTGTDGRIARAAALMARFAGYSGVGRKTTVGMGQVVVEG